MPKVYRKQDTFRGNIKHLAILLESIEQKTSGIWNDWRRENHEMPDLMGVTLSGADLSNFDFSATAFDDANLSDANFTSCDLSGANFYRANMTRVQMLHASAYGGQFRKANLANASLLGTVFNSANLKGATLTGCKIHGIGRTGWEIEDVVCDYVYTGPLGEGRFPKEKDFENGEFEKIYKTYPLIDLEFHDKFDALTILMVNFASIQLNKEDGKFDFQVKEVSTYGNIPTIKVSVKTKEQILEGTELLKKRIDDLQEQLASRQVDVDKLYGLLTEAMSGPPRIQNTFNSDVSIGQFINGNSFGRQTNMPNDLSGDIYLKLVKEIESSDLPKKDKTIGKKLLDEVKNNATSATQKQVGSWANSLTKKALEQLPKLIEYLC